MHQVLTVMCPNKDVHETPGNLAYRTMCDCFTVCDIQSMSMGEVQSVSQQVRQ